MGRIVVVAPSVMGTKVFPPSTTHVYAPVVDPRQTYTSMASTNFTNLVAQVPAQHNYHDVYYNPMLSELEWRLPFDQERHANTILSGRIIWLPSEHFRHRFWDKQEFTDWVEANLKGDVLVQRAPQDGWNVCCVNLEDYDALKAFYARPKRHRVDVTFETPEDRAIIEAWIADNVRGQIERLASRHIENGLGSLSVCIRDQKEAVHMRLRFSEVVREAQDADP